MNPYVIETLANAWTQERIADAAAWRARLASRQRVAHLREAVRRQVVHTVRGFAEALRAIGPA